jgi:dUTP pyrophosphatase
VDVPVRRLDPDLPLPAYAHPGDAGADLVAAEDVVLAPGERRLVPTGIAIALPDGYVGLVHPRSGLAHRLGVTVLNAPGTVDAGYRGEIKVNLINLDPTTPLTLRRGDRVAQLVVQPVVRARFVPVAQLPDSARGEGGHGSTGHGATGDPAADLAADLAVVPVGERA